MLFSNGGTKHGLAGGQKLYSWVRHWLKGTKHVDVIFLVLDEPFNLHTKYFLMEWQTTAVKSS